MAVVFISPKSRQKMFLMAITIVLILFLGTISAGVFLIKPAEEPMTVTLNKPKVEINMGVFDTDQFKKLQSFAEMKNQYSYIAVTDDNKEEKGFITATSIDDAQQMLIARGLSVKEIKEVIAGRNNPFVPYYTKPAPQPKR